MPSQPENLCPVCLSPFRYQAEQAHLEGLDLAPFGLTSRQLSRHMTHVADRTTLDLVGGLTSAASIAARMQQLARASEAIFALALEQADGKLALQALREARQTLQAMADLGQHVAQLAGSQADGGERVDLDDAIGAYVGGAGRQRPDSPTPTRDEAPAGAALPSAERPALLP